MEQKCRLGPILPCRREWGGEDDHSEEERSPFCDPRIDEFCYCTCGGVSGKEDLHINDSTLVIRSFLLYSFGCKFTRFYASHHAISKQLYILHHVLRRQHRDSRHRVQLRDQKSRQNLPQKLSRYFLLRCSQSCRQVNSQLSDQFYY